MTRHFNQTIRFLMNFLVNKNITKHKLMAQQINLDNIKSSQRSYVTVNAKKLIWDVFFATRSRGINLEYHFPWINDNKFVTCFSLEISNYGRLETLATLIIKKEKIETIGWVGLIGLVCVHPQFRGNGLSSHLMKLAEGYGRNSSLKALILWTTKQEVYRDQGYFEDMRDYFGTVTKVSPLQASEVENNKIYDINLKGCNEDGVPAFASDVIKFSKGLASFTVCKTFTGLLLVEWAGDFQDVITIIEKMLPDQWSINVSEDSEMISILKKNGYKVDLQPGAVRMVRMLTQEKFYDLPYIGILKRI